MLALVVQRGGQRYAGVLKVMSILPFITPPFVIGARAGRAVRPHGPRHGLARRRVRHRSLALDAIVLTGTDWAQIQCRCRSSPTNRRPFAQRNLTAT